MTWHECLDCEVKWQDKDGAKTACWSCGKVPDVGLVIAPRLTSQYGYARPLTPEEWRHTRQEIGVD